MAKPAVKPMMPMQLPELVFVKHKGGAVLGWSAKGKAMAADPGSVGGLLRPDFPVMSLVREDGGLLRPSTSPGERIVRGQISRRASAPPLAHPGRGARMQAAPLRRPRAPVLSVT